MKSMEWVDTQLQRGLPREVIGGIEVFVIGDKVLPVAATGPAIPRAETQLLVTVRGGHYHRPGCRHWDTGDQLVPILQALDAGAVPCSAMPKVSGRWSEDAARRAA